MTPSVMGTCSVAGCVMPIASRLNCFPASVTVSPARRPWTDVTLSRSAATGFSGISPICSSHVGSPRPIPGRKRPGKARLMPAISIASTAGWRTRPETMLVPTGTSLVAESTSVAPTSAGT
jgi:hypothetical protein